MRRVAIGECEYPALIFDKTSHFFVHSNTDVRGFARHTPYDNYYVDRPKHRVLILDFRVGHLTTVLFFITLGIDRIFYNISVFAFQRLYFVLYACFVLLSLFLKSCVTQKAYGYHGFAVTVLYSYPIELCTAQIDL